MNTIEKDGKEYIAISLDGLRNAMCYVENKPELKDLLNTLFEYEQKNVTERIKTFEDACKELEDNHPFVIQYREIFNNFLNGASERNSCDIVAYLKLRIICTALNDGWMPKFEAGEYRYYPFLVLCTKDEIENIDENKKKDLFSTDSGFVYAYTDFDFGSTSVFIGSYLVLKTRELAEYCCKQFIDLWIDFYLTQK